MNPEIKSADILVIADQERLHALFEPEGELLGARIRKAFTIDEGLRLAAVEAPALLFFQGRLGGLSAEIIARHLRMELKAAGTRMVMICTPEDLPETGIKFLYATVDASLSDGQLAREVQAVVASLSSRGKKAHFRANKSSARKTGAEEDKKPDGGQKRGKPARAAKQAAAIQQEDVRPVSTGPELSVPVSAGDAEDIVEIRSRPVPDGDVDISSPEADAVFAANFRETLECALEKATGGGPSPAATASPEFRQESSGAAKPRSPASAGNAVSRGAGVRRVIIIACAIIIPALVLLYFGLRPAPEKPVTRHPAGPVIVTASGSPHPQPAPEVKAPEKIVKNPPPVSAAGQIPDGYFRYEVRRGDTIISILTGRFGLSNRNAAELLPKVLEINGIKRHTVLDVGRTVLIPESMKLQIKK